MEQALDDLRQIDLIKIYNSKKCLVVDDFPEIRGSLTRTLRKFGLDGVDTAADGEEAVRMCSQKIYDIVVCDYNLGQGKDGQQVLEEVRHQGHLPLTSLFVLLTGESSREMVLGAIECQPDDYLTKPYTEVSLRTRLNRAVLRHEALLSIKKAIAAGNCESALQGCNEMIKAGSRYSHDCLKIKGQLLLRLERTNEAEKLYQTVLEKKPLVWARLGLGKAQIKLSKFPEAKAVLEDIIREDNRYIEAHDLLAELHMAQEDLVRAQRATETAAQVSPKSVHRHRALAQIADLNGDDEISAKAHLGAIRWGLNSCHESPQDYFNYVRKVADTVRSGQTSSESSNQVKQAMTYLERARKRYGRSPEMEAQALMVEAQIYHGQGKSAEAAAAAAKAKQMYEEMPAPSVDATLQLARTLKTMDQEEDARSLLTTLAGQHPNDKRLMRVIDGITSEPITEVGKTVAARLTKTGIGHYDQKNFVAAIDVFVRAINAYPRHTGLNLNLIQAIVAATEAGGKKAEWEQLCRRSLKAVGEIKPDHKQFQRYSFLQKQLAKHYPQTLTSN